MLLTVRKIDRAWFVVWEKVILPPAAPIGCVKEARFTVVNRGYNPWPAKGEHQVRLGYRWYDAQRHLLEIGGRWTDLPHPVEPGQTVYLTAPFEPPLALGELQLDWDFYAEGVGWLSAWGALPAEGRVKVVARPDSQWQAPTGYKVSGPFLSAYLQYGPQNVGLPLSSPLQETGQTIQYFQNMALVQDKSGVVRPAPLGVAFLSAREKSAVLEEIFRRKVQPSWPEMIPRQEQIASVSELLPRRGVAQVDGILFYNDELSSDRSTSPAVLSHYHVDREGQIEWLLPWDRAGAADAQWLTKILVSAAPSREKTGRWPAAQLVALGRLLAALLAKFNLPLSALRQASGVQGALTASGGSLPSPDVMAEVTRWFLTGEVKAEFMALQASQGALQEKLASETEKRTQVEAELGTAVQQVGQLRADLERAKRFLEKEQLIRVPRPAIEDLTEQLPRHETKRYQQRSLEAITHLVIHQSGVTSNLPFADLARYHVEKIGWPGVGYHFYILPDGAIQQGNTLETISYQAGQANAYSVGICFAGQFDQFVPTPAQIDAGARLIVWLLQSLSLPLENVVGHGDLPFAREEVLCPGRQWRQGQRWRDRLLSAVMDVREEWLARTRKQIEHYLLFWRQDEEWARSEWLNAESYIAHYHPTAGFSVDEALLARKVTIIGPPWRISEEVDQRLKAAGIKVRRLAGQDAEEIKQLLDALVAHGDPFLQP